MPRDQRAHTSTGFAGEENFSPDATLMLFYAPREPLPSHSFSITAWLGREAKPAFPCPKRTPLLFRSNSFLPCSPPHSRGVVCDIARFDINIFWLITVSRGRTYQIHAHRHTGSISHAECVCVCAVEVLQIERESTNPKHNNFLPCRARAWATNAYWRLTSGRERISERSNLRHTTLPQPCFNHH